MTLEKEQILKRRNETSERKMKKIMLLLFSFTLCACTASIQQVVSSPSLRLRNYNNIIAVLVSASGSTSFNTSTLGGISSTQLTSGEQQAYLALESLQFELMSIGFNFVSDEDQADAIVELSIGSIRYDPLAGWIADQGFVRFRERETGKILASYRAKSQVITPTVNNIISNLSTAIKSNY